MSDHNSSASSGALALGVGALVFAANAPKFASKFSWYWNAKIAPVVEPVLTVIGWTAGLALGGTILWTFGRWFYEFWRDYQIVSCAELVRLRTKHLSLMKEINSKDSELRQYANYTWSLEQEIEALKEELAKTKAKPTTVVDSIVQDIVRGES